MAFTDRLRNRSRQEWLSSLPVILLLAAAILAQTLEYMNAQLSKVGELVWEDYYVLRADIPEPTCNPNVDVETELQRMKAEYEAEAAADELGLFEPEPFDRESAKSSIMSRQAVCAEQHQLSEENRARVTMGVKFFRSLEQGFTLFTLGFAEQQKGLLLSLLFICALTATFKHHHIAFRPVVTHLDHRVSSAAQLVSNLILVYSAWSYQAVTDEPFIELLILGGIGLCIVSFYHLVTLPKDLERGGSIAHASLTIPLYAYMGLIAGNYFLVTEGNANGVVVYIWKVMDQAKVYLHIGLYIWSGMLLKQTKLGERVFNVFKPWQLPPELLAFVAILVMAVPTAYTGASGIIIIAMGVVVYGELRRVGARRQLALAATAMTGSAGVVLRPCLLVVLIAALNKEVVTDQLYGWGGKVFLLSAVLFLLVVILTRQEKLSINSRQQAMKPCLAAIKLLVPYILITVVIGVVYALVLDAYLDEFSAPVILPIIILGILAYEKYVEAAPESVGNKAQVGFEKAIRLATTESTVHIGALLMLMGLSFASGGVIERSGVFEGLPHDFAHTVGAMMMMVVILVGIGMVMDPFGAVVLITGAITGIAYQNGIDPVHFWMVTLVALELGYLSPPVALNHLLTRQVVGEKEALLASQEGGKFWYRHEKILLPLTVMGITLLIVAFVPLMFY